MNSEIEEMPQISFKYNNNWLGKINTLVKQGHKYHESNHLLSDWI